MKTQDEIRTEVTLLMDQYAILGQKAEGWTHTEGKWTTSVYKGGRFKWRANINKKLQGKSSAGFEIDAENPAELIGKLIERMSMKWPP